MGWQWYIPPYQGNTPSLIKPEAVLQSSAVRSIYRRSKVQSAIRLFSAFRLRAMSQHQGFLMRVLLNWSGIPWIFTVKTEAFTQCRIQGLPKSFGRCWPSYLHTAVNTMKNRKEIYKAGGLSFEIRTVGLVDTPL